MNKGDYIIIHDSRTHPLSVFTNSTHTEIVHGKSSEAARKILHNLRDKWNEADRPFTPRKFRTLETWKATLSALEMRHVEHELGVLHMEENKPLFSTFPLWNFDGNPIFTLLLRIPKLFQWLVAQSDITDLLCGDQSSNSDVIRGRDWLRHIEDMEGQAPLDAIGFRQTTMVTIANLIPKAVTLIPFQPFELLSSELTTVLSEEAFREHLDQYRVLPEYALVRRTEHSKYKLETEEDLECCGYKLFAWIDHEGVLYQRHVQGFVRQLPDSTEYRFVDQDPSPVNARLMLWQTVELPMCSVPILECVQRRIVGSYIPPSRVNIEIIPFRQPMSCTSTEIDNLRDEDFPIIAQPKLDGNRIIVYIFGCERTTSVKYYSRNGIVQTSKFNEQFDRDVIPFYLALREKLSWSGAVMLDCECYANDVIHAEIGGWCNRVAISPEFRKLKLFVLSWLDLSNLVIEKLRGREYTISTTTFADMLGWYTELNEITSMIARRNQAIQGAEIPLMICMNELNLVSTREELYTLMSKMVDAGAEGLVLYPLNRPYTFVNAGLKKIKRFYDGECTVLSYRASTTDPSEIGSVLVRASARFSKDPNAQVVTFHVNAALRQELKQASMTSAQFANCIGRSFTIICGSFSDDGVPIHARFKAPFGLESERLDA